MTKQNHSTNILIVIHQTNSKDGSNKAISTLLPRLKEAGFIPHIAMPDKNGIYTKLKEEGYPIFVSTYRNSTYPHWTTTKEKILFLPRLLARLFSNWMTTKRLTAYARSNDIALIHTNVGVCSVGYLAARRLNIPHIFHIREYADLIGLHYYPTKQTFLHYLASPHCHSICITKDIQRHFGQSDNPRSHVIYDGVCHSVADFTPQKDTSSYFLYVGRVEYIKGIEHMLEAFNEYVKKNGNKSLPLYIAGSVTRKDFQNKISDYLCQHQLGQHVHLLGQRDDVPQLLEKAKALILPSLFEGFGFCMPEAMFAGCLVIARNCSGTKEQLDNGKELEGEEIALRYETTEELVQLIEEVANNTDDHYQSYRARAFHTVNCLYTTEKNAARIISLYQNILYDSNIIDNL